MSDYLHNLVTRSLNMTRVARPRLASLFEPPFAGFGSPAPFETENAEGEPRAYEAAHTGDLRDTDPPSKPPHADASSHPPSPQTYAPDRAPAPFNFTPPDEEETSPATGQMIQPPGTPPLGVAQAASQPEEHAASRMRSGEGEGRSLEERVRRILDEELKAHGSRDTHVGTILRERARVVERRVAPAPPVAPQPSRSSVESEAQGPDAAPTIRVTIGRVNVRAVVSSKPKEPKREPARPRPMLSLEDYLGRRNGGSR